MRQPRFSIIIPCHNEEAILPHLLDDLVAQTGGSFEVVVADSASSDNTGEVARSYAQQLPLTVIRCNRPGVALARNSGARHARGDYLMFIDADLQLPADFIATVTQEVDRRHLDVAGFRQRLAEAPAGLKAGGVIMNSYVRLMSQTNMPIFFSCYLCRRSLHETIDGFDEQLYIMEDYDYATRAKRAGGRFGIIRSTYFLGSVRRYRGSQGGRQILRGIYGELYRYTHGLKVHKHIYAYGMGGKKRRKRKSAN